MPDSNHASQPGEPTPPTEKKSSAFSRLITSLKQRWGKQDDAQLQFDFDSAASASSPAPDSPPLSVERSTERFVLPDAPAATAPTEPAAHAESAPQSTLAPIAPDLDETLGERPVVGVTQWIGVWRERWAKAAAASHARAEAAEAARAQADAEAAAQAAKENAVVAQSAPQTGTTPDTHSDLHADSQPASSKLQSALAFLASRIRLAGRSASTPQTLDSHVEAPPAPTADVLGDIPTEMPAEKPVRFAGLRAFLASLSGRLRLGQRSTDSTTPVENITDSADPAITSSPSAAPLQGGLRFTGSVSPAQAASQPREPEPVETATHMTPPETAIDSPSRLAAARATIARLFARLRRDSRRSDAATDAAEPVAPSQPIAPPAPALPPKPLTPAQIADRRINWVARAAMITLTAGFIGLVGRVIQLQALPPAPIERLVGSQRSVVKITESRGKIEDRTGRILAATTAVKQLFVDPQLITDLGTFSEKVAFALGLNPVEVEKKIAARLDKQYVVINRELNDDQVEKLKTLKLPGLGTDTRLVRRYPEGQLAAHLIGYVGFDGHGLEGTEKTLNSVLTGSPGQIGYLRDARRRPLWIEDEYYKLPKDGESVRLSIDAVVQAIVEKELADACQQYDAESGSVVMLNPYTGEVLAMANYPTVEPATFGLSPADRRRNRAVTDTFEPGSTFKPFVWAFATEQGYAKPSEKIDCTTSGHWTSANGRRLRDSHPVGTVDWETVLVKSSNIGMAIVGQRMGPEAIYKAVTAFGFGQRTQSGLPGEVRGKVRPFNRWTHYSVTSIPMGQEVSVTGIQMARAFCVFANGGWLPKPTYLALDPMDAAVQAADARPVLKPQSVQEIRQVLRRVVSEGTGKKADSPLYDIIGKTGTAQIAGGKGGYIPDAYVGSFICAAPMQNPQVVVECVIRKPNRSKGYYGGTVAAPAARRIIEQTLNYMGVAPNAPRQDDSDKPVVAANASFQHRIDD